jgi:butyrate kinase
MAAVLCGRVDAILFTGGMAHSQQLTSLLNSQVGWIAPIEIYPGEDELQALAEGALRVLRHEEEPQHFGAAAPCHSQAFSVL